VLKKLFLVLFIIVSLVLPVHTSALTLKQEKDFMDYVALSLNEYIQTVDWSLKRNYDKELDRIESIIQRFSFVRDDYYIGLYADDTKPVLLMVVIKGKANPIVKPQWFFRWSLVRPEMPNQGFPDLNNNRKRYGI